ncbi:uncharacterized protein EI97DRAFT_439648 [Westerdykella ornata]|uniref:Extracellular membrane protein CFEM domain-containing protein n=1 Tax=Westerdykella ornata TaxID=318751 RepID=A0A6A6JRS6_WESOR|nr:uncharacterized protein EI97DRAFT_439648 [Westerdykella ornata]KAF2279272.1 hypothetical protein EI97DRAFT_439648 [Westerdykella ornata]
MRFSLVALALALVAAVAAYPHAEPQFEGPIVTAVPVTPSPSASGRPRPTRTRKHKPHKEPTPTFKPVKPCECIKPIIPVNQLTAKEKCEFEYAHNMACYFRTDGACQKPTFSVSSLPISYTFCIPSMLDSDIEFHSESEEPAGGFLLAIAIDSVFIRDDLLP